ncbi:MAG: hypothetical protein QW498_09080 [Thermofilum sp.]
MRGVLGPFKIDSERYLREVFILSYQRLFGREHQEGEPAWRKAPEDLREILSRRERREVRQGLTFVFEGRIFQLNPLGLRERLSGRWVEVRDLFDGEIRIFTDSGKLVRFEGHKEDFKAFVDKKRSWYNTHKMAGDKIAEHLR